MSQYHTSVLLDEAVAYLNVKKGEKYIDATAGGGGHTEEILKRGGKVLAIDRDADSISYLKDKFIGNKDLVLQLGNFSDLAKIAKEHDFREVSGIIFDLGVSSHQFDDASRGFSFNKESPLDMRMDQGLTITAKDFVNNFDKRRLNEIFWKFGQEKFSLAIAELICSTRQVEPINSTLDLARIVEEVYRRKNEKTKLHPATKVFQALRIVVNSELLNLEEVLPQTLPLLKVGGRLVIISFHSLEDGIVKRFFKQETKLKALTKLPIGPRTGEIEENPRSRSAKMRIAEKISTI